MKKLYRMGISKNYTFKSPLSRGARGVFNHFVVFRDVSILITLLVFACVQPEKPPANLITKEQMINILVDIHIAEAMVDEAHLSKDSSIVIFKDLAIFEKYGIEKENFDESYNYYLRNINMLDDIYTAVVDSLSVRNALLKIKN